MDVRVGLHRRALIHVLLLRSLLLLKLVVVRLVLRQNLLLVLVLRDVVGVLPLPLSLALQLNRNGLERCEAGVLLRVQHIGLLLLLLRGVRCSWVQRGLRLYRLLMLMLRLRLGLRLGLLLMLMLMLGLRLLLLLCGKISLCLCWLLLLVCLLGRGHWRHGRRGRGRSRRRRIRSNRSNRSNGSNRSCSSRSRSSRDRRLRQRPSLSSRGDSKGVGLDGRGRLPRTDRHQARGAIRVERGRGRNGRGRRAPQPRKGAADGRQVETQPPQCGQAERRVVGRAKRARAARSEGAQDASSGSLLVLVLIGNLAVAVSTRPRPIIRSLAGRLPVTVLRTAVGRRRVGRLAAGCEGCPRGGGTSHARALRRRRRRCC